MGTGGPTLRPRRTTERSRLRTAVRLLRLYYIIIILLFAVQRANRLASLLVLYLVVAISPEF
jgi:hypothetical protein